MRIARLSAAILMPLFALTLLGHLAGRARPATPAQTSQVFETYEVFPAMFIENVGQFADGRPLQGLRRPPPIVAGR
jgi:hypothetical protein